jgi:two-component system, OmpR family, response regulator
VKNPKDPIIYIIDSSRTYREIVKNCLEALNFTNVHSFAKSEEIVAFQLIPDIIILDHEFGPNQIKGLEFFQRFRPSHPDTHFIFFSSDARVDIAVESIKSGAHDYIIKSKIGLDRLMKRFTGLITLQLKLRSKKMAFNAAILSLSMVSIIFIVAIILYNKQVF